MHGLVNPDQKTEKSRLGSGCIWKTMCSFTGQKTAPKCVSSAKRASMTDAERKSAQRRKRDLLILIKHKSLVQQNQPMCQLILKRKRSPKQ